MENNEYSLPPEVISNGIKIEIKSEASPAHPEENQDSYFKGKNFVGVCDGMGGVSGGKEASTIAQQYLSNVFSKLSKNISIEDGKKTMSDEIKNVSQIIFKKRQENPIHNGMGTTASVALILENPDGAKTAVIGNVGDSRVYLFRDEKLKQITLDDNSISLENNEEEKARKIQFRLSNIVDPNKEFDLEKDKKEIDYFKNRNVIGQCLGSGGIEPRIYVVDLKPGDKLILSSDGVHDVLTNKQMEEIVKFNLNSDIPSKMISSVKKIRDDHSSYRKKTDDVTVGILEITDNKINTTNETSKPKINFSLDNLRVQRSDGTIENGWQAVNDENGQITVVKEINGKPFRKIITNSTLEKLNRPANIEDIVNAENPKQLFDILDQIGGIQGSVKKYSADEIFDLTTSVLRGKQKIETLTNSGGIRDLVDSWVKSKKRF